MSQPGLGSQRQPEVQVGRWARAIGKEAVGRACRQAARCRQGRAGQGRAGQGRAGQIGSAEQAVSAPVSPLSPARPGEKKPHRLRKRLVFSEAILMFVPSLS